MTKRKQESVGAGAGERTTAREQLDLATVLLEHASLLQRLREDVDALMVWARDATPRIVGAKPVTSPVVVMALRNLHNPSQDLVDGLRRQIEDGGFHG